MIRTATRFALVHLALVTPWALVLWGLIAVAPAQGQSASRPFDHLATGFPLTGAHRNTRCEDCHVNGLFRGTPRACEGCHLPGARVTALSMSPTHLPTAQPCGTCHDTVSFANTRFDHSSVQPGSCSTCHNGVTARGKPANHVPTNQSCDTCHRTTNWPTARFDHAQVTPGSCSTCHNGSSATGKPAQHLPTTQSCDACHQTNGWRPA
ncbi:MAG TPA: cytochrome c3 family protein [Casimicrobiaceae bacterium]|nr:cytochrome c3 family protein [Casimicrobiaceae bacterium]